MIVRAVLLFLIAMAVLAMFGKLRLPSLPGMRKPRLPAARKCPECGAYNPGKGPCPCQSKK